MAAHAPFPGPVPLPGPNPRPQRPPGEGDESGPLRPAVGGVTVDVLASAGSSASTVRGIHGNVLKVAVRAAPERGKANDELVAVLAAFFGVAPSAVTLASGPTRRTKRFHIAALPMEQARQRLRELE